MKSVRIWAAVAAFMMVAGTAAAQWAPSQPVRMWIAFGPGGSLDVVSRALAGELERQTGWQVIAENMPSGGGIAMMSRLANAPADGETIGVAVNMPIITNLARRGDQVPFTLDSFAYLASITRGEKGLFVNAGAPYQTVAEMIAYAQEHGLVIAANPGPETVIVQALIEASGGTIRRLATESGAQSLTYVFGGQADAAFGSGLQRQYIDDGTIRMIASTGRERLSFAPDILTLLEQGIDFYLDAFFFVAAPTGLDAETQEALANALDAAIQSDSVRAVVRQVLQSEVENFGVDGTRERLQAGLEGMGPMFE